MREWLILLGFVGIVWLVHIAATKDHALTLPDSVREQVGASADTVWSRFYAHFTSPFFHDRVSHLAYNTAILAIVLPLALRAYGPKAMLLGYFASPIAGVAIDLFLILPLAHAGWPSAIETAHTRLVGASVIAFALAGMVIVAHAPRLGHFAFALAGAIVVYEVGLALLGVTRPFIWAYHLGGLGVGSALAALVRTTASPP